MNFKLKKLTKKTIPLIIIFFAIILSVITITFGSNIIESLTTNINYKESLSAERQEVYNKMKIDYVNIKNRVTGTAPWNSGDTSNSDGVDVSETDEYVRTFDVLKYTVELGISPNKEEDGVTDTSTFTGGVIKVRAKLPNQGDLTLMTFEQDAWMQNVTYNDDKTEIYAEYHVPSSVSVTNANQNLTFTVKVGGYKKEVTSDMNPTFEVWMEGNQPDDSSSTIPSLSVQDEKKIIISGKPSYDVSLATSTYKYSGTRDNLDGYYIAYGIGIALYQPVSGFSDLRGVEYPTGKFEVELDSSYYAHDILSTDDAFLVDENTANSLGVLNKSSLIGYSVNYTNNTNYYPTSFVYTRDLPKGIGGGDRGVTDSGNMNLSMDSTKTTISFENYVLNGHYPVRNTYATNDTINFSSNMGYFAIGNVQMFVPYYDNDSSIEYDYTYNTSISSIKYYDTNGNNYEISASEEVKTSNNKIAVGFSKRLSGSFYIASHITKNNSEARDGLAAAMVGEYVTPYFTLMPETGPYEGGAERLIVWDSSFYELSKNSSNNWYSISCSSELGFSCPSADTFSMKYGIYNDDPDNGVSDDDLINSARSDDFTWYDTYDEASTHGKVAALLGYDDEVVGNRVHRLINLNLLVKKDSNLIGKVGMVAHRCIIYGDEEKTKVYRPYDTAVYKKTVYNNDGTIASTHSPYNIGLSVLALGMKASVTTTVSDLDSSGNMKSAYDVQDGEINFNVTPTLSDGTAISDDNAYFNNILVKTTLPNGLSYQTGSANKTPESVEINTDGTTTITWKYDNWQVNHAAPEYSNITFKADISASLANNVSLEITSVIFSEDDLRVEKYRTGKYGVIISNLAGSKAIKEINKGFVDKEESFEVTSTIGNTGQEDLVNVRTLEILPYNNDENGSKYNGDYTIKFTQIADGQKIYYTTNKIASIGITEDKYGKYTIKDVDLATDSRWIEVSLNEEIPSTATALATVIDNIPSQSENIYTFEVIPKNNKENDLYAFSLTMTSDNLQAAIKTNTVVAKVVERNISGIAFIDSNRNNIYDSGDTLLSNNVVKLLDSTGNIVATTQTDSDGKYSFECVDKGDYYVEFSIPTNYEVISKNGGAANVSNIANSTGKTDIITSQNSTPTEGSINTTNINLGIRKISSELTVKYLEADTNKELADDKVSTVYYGDTYTTESSSSVPNNYELLKKTDNYTGIVSSKTIEVIYYYQKKDSSLETSISKTGPESITAKDEVVKYDITYNAKIVDYIGTGTITIVDTLPYAIDEEKSSLDGGTYNADDKTITWTEEWNNIDTYNSKDSKEITKSIELVYFGIEGTDRNMINSISGHIKLDNNERDIESQTSTDIKIPGKIITHHYIKGTTDKLKDDVESTDLVGESFTSKALDIDGYIITKPETEEYVFTEEAQEVIYEYERIKLKVETVVNGIGGTIVGNEDVLYGDDSTKDFIIIKPDEGYVLGSVLINGVEVELSEEEKKQLILNNFTNMTEDMIIQVTFVKEIVPNPETGSFATFVKLLFAISLLILFYLYKNKSKNKVYKID